MYVEHEQRVPAAWEALATRERVALHLRAVAFRPPRSGDEAAAMQHLARENLQEVLYAFGLATAGLAAGLAFDSLRLQVVLGVMLILAAVSIPGYLVARRR